MVPSLRVILNDQVSGNSACILQEMGKYTVEMLVIDFIFDPGRQVNTISRVISSNACLVLFN